MKAYLAERYMSGAKADAILARTSTKKKKRKAGVSTSNSTASGSGAGPSGLIVDDDALLVAPPKDEEEDDLEDAMVVKDRSFKRRKVDPSRGTTKPSGEEGGGGWTTIQEGATREGDDSPPPTADELPQIAGVVEAAPAAVSGGLLTKAQLRKKLGPKPSDKGKGSEGGDDIARQQETVYRDASGRKIDMKTEKAEAARRKREAVEKEAKKMEWGKGLVQREEKERERAMMERERQKGFSRHADDAELNEEQKAKEMWNDPAAAFLTVRPSRVYLPPDYLTTAQKKRSKGPRRPEYNGPAPPPNRFGIKPGYRWDGVDRSNGFEQKYFQRQNERKRQGAESYAWGVDDM